MKKIISIVLAISLLFLIGCSNSSIVEELFPKDVAGFVEMELSKGEIQDAYSIVSKDDLIFFMTTIRYNKDGEIEPLHEEINENEDDGTYIQYIYKYNAKKNKLVDKYEIKDCPIEEIWGIELEDDKLVIYSDSEKKNAYYDYDMNFIEMKDRDLIDAQEVAKTSKFYSPSRTSCNDGYSYYGGEYGFDLFYFFDDMNTLYVYDSKANHMPSAFYKPSDLFLNECYGSFYAEASVNFAVEDYKNATEINSASIDASPYGYDYASTGATGIGNKYAVCIEYFNMNQSDDYDIKMFCWNYNCEPTNQKIDVVKTTYAEMQNENTARIERIKNEFNIDIHINDPCENITENVSCDEDPEPLMLYDNLHAIEYFLELLPQGMVKEIYDNFQWKEWDRQGIRLDLVSTITFDASAFAKSFVDPMELCFMFNTVNSNNLPHEFMHLMDERLNDYVTENHIDEYGWDHIWEELNKGFDHEYDLSEDSHPQYNFDENQFISNYAATNDTEDRAEMFCYIFTCAGEDKPRLEAEAIKKKADVLLEYIRKAFPSVNAVEKAYWEE